MTTATKPQSTGLSAVSTSPAKPTAFLGSVKRTGSGLPSRIVIHGVEGVGKTSLPAYGPNPIFLMTKGETGLETLIDSKRLPEVSHFPECATWEDALAMINELRTEEHDRQTLVIDTMNGLERLCHEHVCRREYNNNWGEKGFSSYQRGYDVSLADWQELLALLDRLREERKMAIFCLTHTKVGPHRNPEGEDYDRYVPDMHRKTWSLTHKWADAVLFANFYDEVVEEKGRAKGRGGRLRYLYTERHASYDAKNRHGLPSEISMGSSGQDAWNNLRDAVKAAKGGAN